MNDTSINKALTVLTGWWPIFWSVTNVFFAVPCIALASYKLWQFESCSHRRCTMRTVVLSIELVANVIRFVYISIAPPFALRVGFVYAFHQIFLTITLPFGLFSNLLLAFYWYELAARTTKTPIVFVRRFKIPLYTVGILMFIYEGSSSIARALYANVDLMTTVGGVLYLIITTAISLFFIVAGKKMIDQLAEMQAKNKERLRAMTYILLSVAVANFFFCVLVGLIGLADFFHTIWGEQISLYVHYFSLYLVSFLQICAFTNRRRRDDTSTAGEEDSTSKGMEVHSNTFSTSPDNVSY